MDKESIIALANQSPKPLWAQKTYEVGADQIGERELAIREKAFELGGRSGEVGQALYDIARVGGMYNEPDQNSDKTVEIAVTLDPETRERISVVLSRTRGGEFGVNYYKTSSDERSEIPHTYDVFLPCFGVDSYSAQELDLRHGWVRWSHEDKDIDIRPDILELADAVISNWEETIEMLGKAVRDPELNPELAASMVRSDAANARREAATAAIRASMIKN